MLVSSSIKSQVIRVEEVNKVALKANKRAFEVEHEVLQVSRARSRVVMVVECLERVLKEAKKKLASKRT